MEIVPSSVDLRSLRCAVAFFVFFAAVAGAGVVATDGSSWLSVGERGARVTSGGDAGHVCCSAYADDSWCGSGG